MTAPAKTRNVNGSDAGGYRMPAPKQRYKTVLDAYAARQARETERTRAGAIRRALDDLKKTGVIK